MTASMYLETPQGRRLAYHKTEGTGPCVVFLGGLKSDMMGTKAVFLEDWAKREGRAFLRFDYSGHGESSGAFTEGCIGDWAEDTLAAVEALTEGPILPVGSSMGGWQSLLLVRALPARLAPRKKRRRKSNKKKQIVTPTTATQQHPPIAF